MTADKMLTNANITKGEDEMTITEFEEFTVKEIRAAQIMASGAMDRAESAFYTLTEIMNDYHSDIIEHTEKGSEAYYSAVAVGRKIDMVIDVLRAAIIDYALTTGDMNRGPVRDLASDYKRGQDAVKCDELLLDVLAESAHAKTSTAKDSVLKLHDMWLHTKVGKALPEIEIFLQRSREGAQSSTTDT